MTDVHPMFLPFSVRLSLLTFKVSKISSKTGLNSSFPCLCTICTFAMFVLVPFTIVLHKWADYTWQAMEQSVERGGLRKSSLIPIHLTFWDFIMLSHLQLYLEVVNYQGHIPLCHTSLSHVYSLTPVWCNSVCGCTLYRISKDHHYFFKNSFITV